MKQTILFSAILLLMVSIVLAQSASKPVTSAPLEQGESQSEAPSKAVGSVQLPAAGETRLVEHDEAILLTSTHGSKLLVLNYWATWCAPCLAEMPYFEAAHQKYASQGVKVVGYSMDYEAYLEEAEAATKSSLKRLSITYPNLLLKVDSNVTFPFFSEEWAGSLPATFFYDEHGNKVAEVLSELNQEELNAKIEELLKQMNQLENQN